MDHLQKVRDPIRPDLIVPYLCAGFELIQQPLELELFRSIPGKHGYEVDTLLNGSLGGRSLSEAAPFLQSWLFFGLLVQIFGTIGIALQKEDFVRTNDEDDLVITTRALPKYVWQWIAIRYHQPRHEIEKQTVLVDSCLYLANAVLNHLSDHDPEAANMETASNNTQTSTYISQYPANNILLSLLILGETLGQARKEIVQYSVGPAMQWKFSSLGTALLVDAGWCIGEIVSLYKTCGASILYYLSTWDRKSLEKDHRRCRSDLTCQAHQMNAKVYKSQHLVSCTGCQEHGISTEFIASMLDVDQAIIPLITVATGLSDTPINVTAADVSNLDAVPRYVAVSHVWSDGKGNPHRNYLPLCQLLHLQARVNALYPPKEEPTPFWMDTICVPVGGPNFWSSRTRAIDRMAITYKAAHRILVFDKSLQMIDSTVSTEEALIRIRYSPWSSRLWTMQEGRLGLALYFQFRDKAISLDDDRAHEYSTRNLQAVHTMLQEMTMAEINQSLGARCLVRALAYMDGSRPMRLAYAQMGPQSDPEEEELRQLALKSLEDSEVEDRLHETWYPVARKVFGSSYGPTEQDGHTRTSINSALMSPIVGHGTEGWIRSRGYAYIVSLDRTSSPYHFAPKTQPSHLFAEVVRALQGRTTSRIEDEPICLCALLGLDVGKVSEIPLLGHNSKRVFAYLASHNKLSALCQKLGLDMDSKLSKCHDQRMARAFQLMDAFPPGILFWNVPRLQQRGWRWAPSTFLRENTKILVGGQNYAKRRDEGLVVQFPAWRLTLDWRAARGMSKIERSTVMVIKAEIKPDSHPFRRSWQQFRILGSITHLQAPKGKKADIGLVLIMDDTRDGNGGLLAAVDSEDDDMTFLTFLTAVERLPRNNADWLTSVTSAAGMWEDPRAWCIG